MRGAFVASNGRSGPGRVVAVVGRVVCWHVACAPAAGGVQRAGPTTRCGVRGAQRAGIACDARLDSQRVGDLVAVMCSLETCGCDVPVRRSTVIRSIRLRRCGMDRGACIAVGRLQAQLTP